MNVKQTKMKNHKKFVRFFECICKGLTEAQLLLVCDPWSDLRKPWLILRNFNREDMSRSKHVRAKDDPFHIRCKSDVGLESVVVPGQVD